MERCLVTEARSADRCAGLHRACNVGARVLPQLPAIPISGSAARISGREFTPAMPSFMRP
jgi:hypothetical protein